MPPSRSPWSAFALGWLLLGSLGVAAAWILVAMALETQGSWMALVAAVDAAVIVRLVRLRPGATRALLGLASTALAVAVANWGLVAAWLGAHMGLLPWESPCPSVSQRVSPVSVSRASTEPLVKVGLVVPR